MDNLDKIIVVVMGVMAVVCFTLCFGGIFVALLKPKWAGNFLFGRREDPVRDILNAKQNAALEEEMVGKHPMCRCMIFATAEEEEEMMDCYQYGNSKGIMGRLHSTSDIRPDEMSEAELLRLWMGKTPLAEAWFAFKLQYMAIRRADDSDDVDQVEMRQLQLKATLAVLNAFGNAKQPVAKPGPVSPPNEIVAGMPNDKQGQEILKIMSMAIWEFNEHPRDFSKEPVSEMDKFQRAYVKDQALAILAMLAQYGFYVGSVSHVD